MTSAVFLTGGTGFLGTEIAADLIRSTTETIYVLTRAEHEEAAYHRLRSAWHTIPDLNAAIGIRIFPVIGDFTQKNLGLDPETRKTLQDQIHLIFHAGAEVGLQVDGKELMTINRKGTANMLAFAAGVTHLDRFVYISTAYVAGQTTGLIREEELSGQHFSSYYEKSKAAAEKLVRASSLPVSICRPGMIVGNSQNGRAKNFNTIYYVLKLYLTGQLSLLPVDKHLGLNLVPVDYVAASAVRIAYDVTAAGKTFHLTCPKSLQPTAVELTDYVRTWAKEHLDIDLQKPIYTPLSALRKAGISYNRKNGAKKKGFLTNLLALMPYFYGNQEFDRTNADALLGDYSLRWQDYIDPVLAFACSKNFMHQTERTVFEQARVRRASKTFPIRYYDVTTDEITQFSGDEVNVRIQKIVDALWAWGIRKGDKIALTGINCVDYMTLDQAIGLIGAVSVPIYYTTPIEEASLLLNRSGAHWFFVGDKRIMEHIENLQADARIVAFSNGLTVHKPNVMHWEQFLDAAKETAPIQYTNPEDLATIRYTSGTTGEPKGVMFNFGQLSWMGEVLTNLLGWKERNETMRYLSFLPQSHVVEGILASYAPYYMLAKVDFYFLNDFGSLADKLPEVRPTVFFSVPRFYEKLWDQLAANKFGKRYLTMEEGPAKRAMAVLLRNVILKKAGLDASAQLIVGSAPVSEELLLKFRELGIEIHNAYGQTEAPLITINRMGDNIIPTIGTPLPETEVTRAEDGELIVKGPQVCLGYYGLETDSIRNGVLKTGDLGTISDNGHITLHGRKKEMIVTAYGKNISIPKIEERLKNIPCVSEAVLIGEHRAYCTALLWTEGDTSLLDAQIEAMNADLSHPEQIRKYKIIDQPLSIQKGELTPNLKVKRANVEEHYQQEIEEMYL